LVVFNIIIFSLNFIIMIDFFKKHSFVIGTYSLGIAILLEYLSQSKWLILPFAVTALLGGIAQVYIGLNKKKS